jgi:FkbM family methyltransferase
VTINLESPYIATKNKGELWKGIYEKSERKLFFKYFPPDLPVIELGASIGVMACVTNKNLTQPDRHIVVEANPHLIPTLEKNREINGCQFKIVTAAVGYDAEQVTFYLDDKFTSGGLEHKTGTPITVPTCTVQSLTQDTDWDHFNVICDIEGTEVDLVQHEITYMQEHIGWFLVERHAKIVGATQIDAMDARLRDSGFELIERIRHVACYRNTRLTGTIAT